MNELHHIENSESPSVRYLSRMQLDMALNTLMEGMEYTPIFRMLAEVKMSEDKEGHLDKWTIDNLKGLFNAAVKQPQVSEVDRRKLEKVVDFLKDY